MHFGLGMGIRNTWGLWGDSRLAKYFKKHGIKHPDNMSGIILDAYVNHLKGKPTNFDWQKNKDDKKQKKQMLHSTPYGKSPVSVNEN